ncbi:MAG TPA: phosphatidylserine/phosphatidylglycerophosphate/cardiolipin synthase family protein, partial [Candidatus Paceibacterota bacterium]|nr:phosphatidylserine/phosphatidylglycerophosphate/cardiolipin synthase family protein [Candidatus Paceibacterota bacterium]
MNGIEPATVCEWMKTGDQVYGAMLAAIQAARRSVRLETYTFAASAVGERFRASLLEARGRGVRVQVMIDALGSWNLGDAFWQALIHAGGELRWFNPLSSVRLGIRNHRKLLVCDDEVAFVGGFNIAPEYEGDGIQRGWKDVGLKVVGALAAELGLTFDRLFLRAGVRQRPIVRLRRAVFQSSLQTPDAVILQSGPGLTRNSIRQVLVRDLRRARSVQIMAAYFLPSWRFRRLLQRLARQGVRVQLLLPGKSDVRLSQLASHRVYEALLRAGVEVYEYQPQILHAKLLILDDLVFVGSANLDVRSLRINYELLLRLKDEKLAGQARSLFMEALQNSRKIDPPSWRTSRSLWTRFQERWAYFLLVRVDPYFARRHWR